MDSTPLFPKVNLRNQKQEYHWKIVKNNDKMEIKERYYKRKEKAYGSSPGNKVGCKRAIK